MPVYLIQSGDDAGELDEFERQLRPVLPDLLRASSFEAVLKKAASEKERSYVIVFAAKSEKEVVKRLIDIISRYAGPLFFILVSGEISGSDYKQLISSQNADWVANGAPPQEVLEIMARNPVRSSAPQGNGARPLVVAFVPSAGGVGNTTLAIETAVLMKKAKDAKEDKICIIDLDFQTSHAADMLDIEAKFRIEDIVNSPDRLDRQLLGSFVSTHAAGVDLLAVPRKNRFLADPPVEALSALFDLVAKEYQVMILDFPVRVAPWSAAVVAAASLAFVTGRNTIPGLRQLAETLQRVSAQASAADKAQAIVNNCDVTLFGGLARADHVATILRDHRPYFVRHSPNAIESVNAGTPLCISDPSSRTVKDIAAIAARCSERRAASAKPASPP